MHYSIERSSLFETKDEGCGGREKAGRWRALTHRGA
jgi:hypothetical protein